MEFETQYLTYAEYTALGGKLAEVPFNILEYRAQKEVDKYTFGRLENLSNQLQETKMCIYDLINVLEKYDNISKNQQNGVVSVSTDGYSESYGNVSQDITISKQKEIKDVVRTYLSNCKLEDGTPYLYIGA
jgi:hypothetical protein